MKNNQTTPYEEQLHTYGRIWVGIALTMMILSPVAICVYYNAWPPITAVSYPGNSFSTKGFATSAQCSAINIRLGKFAPRYFAFGR